VCAVRRWGARTPRMRPARFHARFPLGPVEPMDSPAQDHMQRLARYAEWMTVRELLAEFQHLPRDLEVLAFEAG
jgi:hypothetical protein